MMKLSSALIVIALGMAGLPTAVAAQSPLTTASQHNGQQDFDWEVGRWATNVRILRNPLSGEKPDWAEYRGTSNIVPVAGGRANIVELSVESPTGKIEGVSLRLYNPAARQWSLNFASFRNGLLTEPVFGGFDGRGRGTFIGKDMLDGKAILVRFVVIRQGRDKARFEQAYSVDGGATWELNWIAEDVRR